MTFSTRPLLSTWLGRSRRPTSGAALPDHSQLRTGQEGMDPSVIRVARAVRVAAPETRVAVLVEMLRSSPYRAVPVVAGARGDGSEDSNAVTLGDASLLGLVTEEDLMQAFLNASSPEERARVREMPARAVMQEPVAVATPYERVSSLSSRFADSGTDTIPVVSSTEERRFLGMISRSDLVRDLVRPFRPPSVGGMATPLGVYLTTGGASGGVGTLGLAATGLFTLGLNLVSLAALASLERLLGSLLNQSPLLSDAARQFAALPVIVTAPMAHLIVFLIQFGLFLTLLRLSPLAGYHAAEHQVVHAIERGEPLLVESVQTMPRVHPRCSTNLVAGMLLLSITGSSLESALGWHLSYGLGVVLALCFWRRAGAWLQDRFTTRPATRREIESAIRAARELLTAHSHAPYARIRLHQRLWRMGFAQILLGAATGVGALWVLTQAFPPLHTWFSLLFAG